MATVERLENSRVRVTLEVSPEKFEEGCQAAYIRLRGRIVLQGFRKGKAPRKLIEARYGKDVFYDEAIDIVLPEAYENAVDELNLRVVSRPDVNVDEMGPEGAKVTAEVTVEPDVAIGDYTNIKYAKPEITVTDEQVDAEIEKARLKNSRILPVEGRELRLWDTVKIDFDGYCEGKPFEGGHAEGYPLTIGTHTFIDTFEEQIIGHKVGDRAEIHVTFPEDYGVEALNGKPAVFKIFIESATYRDLPELDDEFAQDTSEFDTFEEYKADVREQLLAGREEEAKKESEERVLEVLAGRADMEVPEVMFNNEVDNMVADLQRRVRMSGMPYEQYLAYMGLTPIGLRESYRPNAVKAVRARLALQAVAANIGITADDDEVDAEIARMASEYGWEASEMKKNMSKRERESVRRDLVMQKTSAKVMETAEEE